MIDPSNAKTDSVTVVPKSIFLLRRHGPRRAPAIRSQSRQVFSERGHVAIPKDEGQCRRTTARRGWLDFAAERPRAHWR